MAKQIVTTREVSPAETVAWDADVYVSALFNPKGNAIPGEFGVYSVEGDIFLGNYKKETSLLKNVELIAYFESALDEMRLKFKREIRCNGSEMRAFYTIESITFDGPDGKPIALRVQITNSYNGRLKVQGIVEALRLICLNGMIGFGETFNLAQRHSSKLDVKGIVSKLVPELDSAPSAFESLKRLVDVQLNNEQGEFFLRNLSKETGPLSGLMARKIETAWQNPTEDEKDSHNTIWGLYNAGTRVMRDMESDKVELVQKVGTYYSLALDKAAREPKTFKRLIKPIKYDDAYAHGNSKLIEA